MESVLKNITALTQNKDFKKYSGKPFTLIIPQMYMQFVNDIEKIITPFNGSVIVDDVFINKKIEPVIEHLIESR